MMPILPTRRTVLAGAIGTLVMPALPAFAATASRTFGVFRGDEPIGTHRVDVMRGPDGVTARSDIKIAVKRLGITVYRYELLCTDSYDEAGMLVSMDGTCNDDGDQHFVRANRTDGQLVVNGSVYNGPVTPQAGVASYWRNDALQATPWISTQSGELLAVSVSPISSVEVPGAANVYRASNGTDYTIDLFYDARGEWVGSAFDAKGERATIRMTDETGALQG